jgi:predicted PurR-regulated permease PerM
MDISKSPLYVQASLIFMGLCAFTGMLYIAQGIIVPLIYSTMIAIALNPMVKFFVRKKMSRVLAITVSLTIVFLVLTLCVVLLSAQLSIFIEAFPRVVNKFYETFNRTVTWASKYFNISPKKIDAFIIDAKTELVNSGKSSIGATLAVLGNALIILLLIPVYVFMILFYQPLLLDFIRRLFGDGNLDKVNRILGSSKIIIQKYLIGLLFEALIVAVLNSVGLLVIGIDYAIILGIIGAILNIIPYIGGIVAVALPMMVAIVTQSSPSSALLVLLAYLIIQFVDNNYVIPMVVASKVRINALVSIIVVLVGGALWGVAGMFLSIPLTAILKVIFDHIEELEPWGFLLGDTMPAIEIFRLKKRIKKPAAT